MSLDGRKFTLCDPGLNPQVFARAGSVFDVGEDPLLAPDGIYGEFGATHARRSIALGLATTAPDKRQGDTSGGGGGGGGGALNRKQSEWGSMVSHSSVLGGDSESCVVAGGGKSLRIGGPCEVSMFLGYPEDAHKDMDDTRQVVEEEVQDCLETKSPALHLYDLGIRDIVEIAGPLLVQCTHLTALDLSYNFITSIPPEIALLQSLERLCLRSNLLTKLPDEISQLPLLSDLLLEQNQLTALPPSLAEMAELRVLALDWNDLEAFPVEACEIVHLQELHLIENPGIVALPIEKLKKLQSCLLSIDNIPSIVSQWNEHGDGVGSITINFNKVYPDKILPGLFLGSLRSAQSVRVYQELNIRYLATIGRELKTVLDEGMEQIQMMVDDLPGTDISSVFDEVHAFIDTAIRNGSACLVHCFKGQSRSASCVISYVIKKYSWSFEQAEQFVRDRSPRIQPNKAFVALLQQYAKSVAAAKALGQP